MSTNFDDDTARQALTRERDLIVDRLTRSLGAFDRKRLPPNDVVPDVSARAPPASREALRGAALVGVAAGGIALALGLLLRHLRRAHAPRGDLEGATALGPPQGSRLLREALRSLATSLASEAARALVARALMSSLASPAAAPPSTPRERA